MPHATARYRRTLLIITFNGYVDRVVRAIKRLGLKAETVMLVMVFLNNNEYIVRELLLLGNRFPEMKPTPVYHRMPVTKINFAYRQKDTFFKGLCPYLSFG